MQQTFSKVYENFIEEIDAIDNGISTHDGLPRYKVTTTLSSRVGNLNARWNEEGEVDETARFHQAMELVKTEFLDRVDYFAKSWWPARYVSHFFVFLIYFVDWHKFTFIGPGSW